MDIHYNAFISYRHHPEDIRVATEIHRALERFKVPKAIRKRTKGITRLFRDKDELPITSSLTDDITRALKNSDYLIVICSTHTKESVWVQREIETFLKTHDRNRVLTVLVDGEPYDTIPEILLYEDVVNPVTGEIVRNAIEPLSCDWRMPRRKARQEELPRLAAALLNCGYDELRQRQRQYRTRRLITIFSAALMASLCLAAYFLYTSIQIQKANDDLNAANEQIREANVQIQNNLSEALRNQSEYLTSASQSRSDEGDRLTAIALAMAALPDESNDRPYVPAAELALGTALSLYDPEQTIEAVGVMDPGLLVTDFEMSYEGDTAYLLDERNLITVWDTETFQKRQTVDLGATDVYDLEFTVDGNLIVEYRTDVSMAACISPDGAVLWNHWDCIDTAFLNSRETLMVLKTAQGIENHSEILFLDPESGAVQRDPLLFSNPEGEYPTDFYDSSYSGDHPITLAYRSSDPERADDRIVSLVDLSEGRLRKLMTSTIDNSQLSYIGTIDCVSVTDEGNILVMMSDGSGVMNGYMYGMTTTSEDREVVRCYNGKTLGLMWETDIACYSYSGNYAMESIPDSDRILLQSGNALQIVEARTGRIISKCETVSGIVELTVYSDCASCLLQNGSFSVYTYDDNECNSLELMEDNLREAQIANGYYSLKISDTKVTAYRHVYDEDWHAMEVGEEMYAPSRLTKDHLLAVMTNQSLYMIDMRTEQIVWQTETGYGKKLLGFSEDGAVLYVLNDYDEQILALDTSSGSQTAMDIPREMDELGYIQGNCWYAEEKLYYMLEMFNASYLTQMDLKTGEMISGLPLTDENGQPWDCSYNDEIIMVSGDWCWIWLTDGRVCEVSLESGEYEVLLTDLEAAPICQFIEEKNQYILYVDNQMIQRTPDGSMERTEFEDAEPISLYFYGDNGLVLCDDGYVYRFDQNWKQLERIALTTYSGLRSDAEFMGNDPMSIFWEQTPDGDLILSVFEAGNIIDCDEWDAKAFVPQLQAYYGGTDTLFCAYDGDLGTFRRVTTAQLLQKAREQLNGFELTDEQKKYYGLD